MKLNREFAIGAFDLLAGGVSRNAKHLVVIAFLSCHVANQSCVTCGLEREARKPPHCFAGPLETTTLEGRSNRSFNR